MTQITAPNGMAMFSVVVSSPSPVTYQWRFNGSPIGDATGDSLVLSGVTAANEGNYSVIVTNASGSVTSADAKLYLDADGDDMADTLETTYFGNLNQVGGGDFDGDGVSNLDELREGTNPASNTSLNPRLTIVSIGGTVTASPIKAYYSYSESVAVSATADPGNGFFGWSSGLSGGANPATVVMNGNKTVSANFNGHGVIGWGNNGDGEVTIPSGLNNVIALAAGNFHTLALKSDGTVSGWGYNGDNETAVPAGLNTAVAIAAGARHSLALKADGTVVGWGSNSSGQTTVPAGLSGVVAIAANENHSLALKNDGTVVGWGNNSYGQITPPAGLNTAIAIAAGERHAIALKADGTVVGWGNNSSNQITIPAGLNNVAAIAAGNLHNLALKKDGTLVAWGYNSDGETTIPAAAQTGVVAIAAGGYHNLALKSDGSVVAWGYNGNGQTTIPSGVISIVAIAAGENHSLALEPSEPGVATPVIISPVYALGDKDSPFYYRVVARNSPTSYGATGLPAGVTIDAATGIISGTPGIGGTYNATITATNGSGATQKALTITINLPVPIVTSTTAAVGLINNSFAYQITASNNPTSYAASGLPYGLTINTSTGLISGAPKQFGVFPVTISATNAYGTGMLTLTLETKTIVGWGNNADGEVTIPSGLNNVIALAAGNFHTLALKSDGTVSGWGYNG
ncbi:MAG TPA: putative Ig domain-containing protein, partial [Chthoniobacterales bacterium]